MPPNVAEILEFARALSSDERTDLAHELLVGIGEDDGEDAAKLEVFRAAVAAAEASLDAGKGVHVPLSELREYIRDIGREATARVASKIG